MLELGTDVQYVKGVGPKRAEAMAARGIRTVEDLLYHLPFRYEDRSRLVKLRQAREGTVVTVAGRISQATLNRTRRRGFTVYQALVDDGTGTLRLVFFNQPWLAESLVRGVSVFVHGRIERSERTQALQLTNPSFEIVDDADRSAAWDALVPVAVALPGFTPRAQRRLMRTLLDALPDELPATLPAGVEERLRLLPRRAALERVHFPPKGSDAEEYGRRASEAHRRLAFEELFAMQAAFLLRRRDLGLRPAHRTYATSREKGDLLRAALPFRLTAGQRQAFRDVVADLGRPLPMARLLQGDVGSGKTIVALLAMLLAAANDVQSALMAPTELLAEQHARNFRRILGLSRPVGLLTGSMPAKERRATLAALARGDLHLVVGTHALIQEGVRFRRLGLVVVDEQHRFGLEQRARLAAKAENPDVLVMSATPIPRTLALTLHGDLDVSVLSDRPPGRKPVRTAVRDERSRAKVLRFLADEIARGRQAYVVHPLIEETEEEDVVAATEGAARLAEELPQARVGLVHGRLPPEARDAVMRAFAAGDVDALVATTVIEVGLDVPNATLMIVEAAERFGLAQLHQLRGRVGRGAHESWCILMRGPSPTPEGKRRLRLLETIDDGFVLAEKDLEMRGAGQFFGARQAGLRDLRVADPVRDRDLLLAARREAELWVKGLDDRARASDPLARAIDLRWRTAVERSSVG